VSVRTGLYSVALAAAVALRPAPSAATNLALDRFDPAPAGDRLFATESAEVAGPLEIDARLVASFAHNPLVFYSKADGKAAGSVVTSQALSHFGGSLALFGRVVLSLDVPLALAQSGPSPTLNGVTVTSPSGAHIADARFGVRLPIVAMWGSLVRASVAGYLWAPLGSSGSQSGAFTSDGSLRARVALICGGENERLFWSVSAGPDLRKSQDYLGVRQATMIRLAGGAGLFLLDAKRAQIGAELVAAAVPSNVSRYNTNAELLIGGRYRLPIGLDLGLGAGPGLSSGIGTPDYRIVGTLAYNVGEKAPPRDRDGDGIGDAQDACPDAAGIAATDPAKNGCPPDHDDDGIGDAQDACPDVAGVAATNPAKNGCPPDRDGDGIPDAQDACPDVAGVAATDPAKNGCPPDRDGDGIPDAQDACPDVTGVAATDPAKNGCPPDRDGDGIADAHDACPDVKGPPSDEPTKNGCPPPGDRDSDGIGDDMDACPDIAGVPSRDKAKNGCPPPSDRDKDGIPDAQDACPDTPGIASLDANKNGCPTGAIVGDQIVVLEPVKFETDSDVLLKDSEQILATVLASIEKLPRGNRYRIEGHTDNRGKAKHNRDLSMRRAKSVVRWMVAHGLAETQFDAKGLGPDKPIASNTSEKGRAANRRVEIHIIAVPAAGGTP